ncbi:high mobility group protein 20A isoform X2 [Belonocnema kinseyi]|uniref:high mobility group protein 20A isoform X2 n=1 Tax=Belonocnema kinseyi TaxID=2817044 RepID=UPI00143D5523|nr:high mobility group protein 20A isoform X2 [Belonocnema kinseyi]
MSESAPTNNNVAESNGVIDHPAFNGGTEDPPKEKAQDATSEGGSKKATPTTTAGTTPTAPANRPKKRKKPVRDATAPKIPLTGYFRFLNDRREKVRAENPAMPFAEITKLLASEWSNLPADQKQQYLDAAEQDKERYNREIIDYKQTEAYRLFNEKQTEKLNESKKERNGSEVSLEQNDVPPEKDDFSGFDIPIFTEEFLDHNKACEAELRQLRKATADYEGQNAVLQRHVDSLHAAVNRLESETNQQRSSNQALQRHLDNLRSQLTGCFATIPLQGTHEAATPQNIDSYVEKLESLLSGGIDPSLRNAVRNAVSHFELIG